MAHLEVEPKKSTPWIWIVLGLVVLAILFFVLKGGGEGDRDKTVTDTTAQVNTRSISQTII